MMGFCTGHGHNNWSTKFIAGALIFNISQIFGPAPVGKKILEEENVVEHIERSAMAIAVFSAGCCGFQAR